MRWSSLGLQRTSNARREELIGLRAERVARWNAGALPDFLNDTRASRADAGVARPARPARTARGIPPGRPQEVSRSNSGARGFMADFEDSLRRLVERSRRAQ